MSVPAAGLRRQAGWVCGVRRERRRWRRLGALRITGLGRLWTFRVTGLGRLRAFWVAGLRGLGWRQSDRVSLRVSALGDSHSLNISRCRSVRRVDCFGDSLGLRSRAVVGIDRLRWRRGGRLSGMVARLVSTAVDGGGLGRGVVRGSQVGGVESGAALRGYGSRAWNPGVSRHGNRLRLVRRTFTGVTNSGRWLRRLRSHVASAMGLACRVACSMG